MFGGVTDVLTLIGKGIKKCKGKLMINSIILSTFSRLFFF